MQYKLVLSMLLFFFGIYAIYRGFRAIKTKNLYWVAPTITGFKDRKKERSSLGIAILTGISTTLFGVFIIYISIMIFIHNL